MAIARTVSDRPQVDVRDGGFAGELCAQVPELPDLIRQRMAQHPEYRAWLERFGQEILTAVGTSQEAAQDGRIGTTE
jgi:hypothetical protein